MKYLFRVRDQNKSQEIKKCLELHRSKMAKRQARASPLIAQGSHDQRAVWGGRGQSVTKSPRPIEKAN